MTDTLTRRRVNPSELEGMDLGSHDELPVTRSAAKITGAGDGLSEALAMAAVHIPAESEVVIVIPAKVLRHAYERVAEGRGADRVALEEFIETTTYKAQAAFFVDPDLLDEVIERHMERRAIHRADLERERREARGEFELPLVEGSTNGAEP